MNINQKAQELAKLIKTTDEFQTMNKYKREIEKNKNIKKLVMPKIGCGLDRLSWCKVEPMVQEIFKDLDIEIVVCYL